MLLESYIPERGLVVVTVAVEAAGTGGGVLAVTTIHEAGTQGAPGRRLLCHDHATTDPALVVARHGRIVALVRAGTALRIRSREVA